MNSNQIRWSDIHGTTIDHCKCGTFRTYCYLMSSCDQCNRKIRFLCKIKCKIEDLQKKNIIKELNKRPE